MTSVSGRAAWLIVVAACFPEFGFREDGTGGGGEPGTGGDQRPNGGSSAGAQGPVGGGPTAGGQGGSGGMPSTSTGDNGGGGVGGTGGTGGDPVGTGGSPPTVPVLKCGEAAMGVQPLVQCEAGQICCLDDSGTDAIDKCASPGGCSMGDTVLACDDATDCPGQTCCYLSFASSCKPSCQGNEVVMCKSDNECTGFFELCLPAFYDDFYEDNYLACQ